MFGCAGIVVCYARPVKLWARRQRPPATGRRSASAFLRLGPDQEDSERLSPSENNDASSPV